MGYFGELGKSAGTQAVGTVFGSLGKGIGAAISYPYAKKMAKLNYRLNEQAANNADARRRALYADYESPMATIRQLKEAGLSPSMYASGELGGSIGTTAGAQGSGASGVGLPNLDISPIDMATIKVQEAQARLYNTEADKIEGKNAEGEATIKALEANAKAAFAKAGLDEESTELVKTNNLIEKIRLEINDQTKNASIHKIKMDAKAAENNANKLFWDGENAQLDWTWKVDTWETEKQKLANSVAEIAAKAALEQSQVRLNDEEKKHIVDFANAQLEQAKAHTENARNYGNWVEANKENMREQIRLRGEELNVEKWRIGVDAVVDIVQGGLFAMGYNLFRSNETTTIKENYAPNGASRGHSVTTKTKGRK